MRNLKFVPPAIPQTTQKTIRFPNDLIQEVEDALVNRDSNFSAFVIAAVKFALENLDTEDTDDINV